MNDRTASDSRIETVELVFIPVSGGRRLAARLFLPKDAARQPVPCILEYLPYRRRDGTRYRDDAKYRWFAANGYAGARVDIAGTGDSDGLVEDEYIKREQDDCLEVIAWLATQDWCSGAVGMMGISWGGFNGLQVAARRPPALKAIITSCSTDDRYGCDAHYIGGCLINDNVAWGGAFFNYAGLPPDPAMVGSDRWRGMWKSRLDNLPLFPAVWLRHQRRDAYWKHGSVCEDFSAIACPVLAVGGWLDGYTPTVFNLVENLAVPCKGIVGPWGHQEPHNGVPAPAIDYLGECKRWWDRWLKGIDTGVERDPDMRIFLMDYARPLSHFVERPGKWLSFKTWPSPKLETRQMYLSASALVAVKPATKAEWSSISSPQTVGIKGQEWCPYGQGRIAAEGATDQREDDAGSLCFDTAPLKAPLHLVGSSRVLLRIAADRPQALVAVHLNDIAADGTSALITQGILNLSHRDSHEFPEPLSPGKFYNVEVALKPVGQTVPKGHRLRLAVATSNWPMAWPSPEVVTLTLDPARSRLELATLPSLVGLGGCSFGPARAARPAPVTVASPGCETRDIHHDVVTQKTTFDIFSDSGAFTFDDIGTLQRSTRRKIYSIDRDDPTSCESAVTFTQTYRRGDWNVSIESEVRVRADRTHFHCSGWIKAHDGDDEFASREFREKIKRDCL